jgi:hypothetical protein
MCFIDRKHQVYLQTPNLECKAGKIGGKVQKNSKKKIDFSLKNKLTKK